MAHYQTFDSATAHLRTVAASLGLELPAAIDTSGKFTNIFQGKQKVGAYTFNFNSDGSCGGYVQNMKLPVSEGKRNWCFRGATASPADSEKAKHEIAQAQRRRRLQEAAAHKKTAAKARSIYEKTIPAPVDFPYLRTKGIKAHNARLNLYNGIASLVIPIGNRQLGYCNLQIISADGTKYFLKGGQKKGCYSILNFSKATPPLIGIAEGFATAASLLEHAQKDGVAMMSIMASDAGNLQPVAMTIKKLYPATPIIIFGDNDTNKIGQLAARTAAQSIDARFLIPRSAGDDFNDLISRGAAPPFSQLISLATFTH